MLFHNSCQSTYCYSVRSTKPTQIYQNIFIQINFAQEVSSYRFNSSIISPVFFAFINFYYLDFIRFCYFGSLQGFAHNVTIPLYRLLIRIFDKMPTHFYFVACTIEMHIRSHYLKKYF